MVVSLNIANYDVCRVLIDNESSVDVLFDDAFSQMDISLDRLGQLDSPLMGFIGDAVPVEGVITLLIVVGQPPWRSEAQADFLVVSGTVGLQRHPRMPRTQHSSSGGVHLPSKDEVSNRVRN